MKIITEFDPEEWVYLKHDPDQLRRMIVEIRITKMGWVYKVMCGTEESEHYEFELDENPIQSFPKKLST